MICCRQSGLLRTSGHQLSMLRGRISIQRHGTSCSEYGLHGEPARLATGINYIIVTLDYVKHTQQLVQAPSDTQHLCNGGRSTHPERIKGRIQKLYFDDCSSTRFHSISLVIIYYYAQLPSHYIYLKLHSTHRLLTESRGASVCALELHRLNQIKKVDRLLITYDLSKMQSLCLKEIDLFGSQENSGRTACGKGWYDVEIPRSYCPTTIYSSAGT